MSLINPLLFITMSPAKILARSLFYIIITHAVVSCNNRQESTIFSVESTIDFDSTAYSLELASTPEEAKWSYISAFTQLRFNNPVAADLWLNAKLEKLLHTTNPQDESLLQQLLNFIEAADYHNSLLTISQFVFDSFGREKSIELRASAALNLAFESLEMNDYSSLKDQIDVVSDELPQLLNKNSLASYYALKAAYFDIVGDYFKSVINYHKALQYITPDSRYNLGTLYHNLAVLYINLEYYEKANHFVEAFESVFTKDDIPPRYLITKAITKMRLGNYAESDAIYQKLIRQGILDDNVVLLAQLYANRGNLLRRQKNYGAAFKSIEKSDSICKLMDFEYGLVLNTINKSEIHFDQGNYEQVLDYLEELEPEVTASSNNRIKRSVYESLYKANDSLGNTNLANHYFRLFTENRDPYIGDLPRSFIAEWLLDEENKKLVAQQHQLEVQREKRLKERFLLSLIILFVLFVSAYIYFRTQRKVLLEKIQINSVKQELEIRSKEITAQTLKAASINNYKDQLSEKLENLKSSLPKEHQANFEPITKELSRGSQKNLFKEFDLSFTKVHENFYENLRELAPSLKSNEIRVCAFIKLNFSTKEICEITNRSQGTVENLRVSIRKKLQLKPEDNLYQFLLKL